MIPRVYDTQRVVRVMGDDDAVKHETINRPLPVPKKTKSGAIQTVMHDMTVGKYDVTVGVGPGYATARAEAADDMTAMAQAWPKLMDVAGDRMIRAKMWPDADLIADRIRKTMPPELVAGEGEGEGEGEDQQAQIPPQIQQQLQQYDAALSDAMQQIEALRKDQQTAIEQAQIKADADVQIAVIKAQADIEAKTRVQEIAAQGDQGHPREPQVPDDQQPGMIADALAMVAQAVAAQTAAVAAPKRKVMRIQAPSGGVYEGEVVDQVVDDGVTDDDQ
jgi:hypothetical protein